MKLNKLFLGLLGMAAFTFAACSDNDDDYTPATVSGTQVFFNSGLPSKVEISPEATSFNVVIERVDSTAAVSVPLTSKITEGSIFSVPASVNFDAGQRKATIPVSYDPAKIEYGRYDTISVTIADAQLTTPYGITTYSFLAGVTDWGPWKKWNEAGTCTYTYNNYYSVDDTGLAFKYRQNQLKPNLYQFMIGEEPYKDADGDMVGGWANAGDGGIVLILDYDSETGHVTCSPVKAAVSSSYGDVYVADSYYYWFNVRGTDISKMSEDDYGKFDPEGGYIYIPMAWYVSAGTFGYEIETITIDGYERADLTSEVAYAGKLTDANDNPFVLATITLGADVSYANVALVSGTEIGEEDLVKIIDGTFEPLQQITESGEVRFDASSLTSGNYTFVVVPFQGEEASLETASTASFKYIAGAGESWSVVGSGVYTYGVEALSKDAESFYEGSDNATLYQSDQLPSNYYLEPWAQAEGGLHFEIGEDGGIRFYQGTGEHYVTQDGTDYGEVFFLDIEAYNPDYTKYLGTYDEETKTFTFSGIYNIPGVGGFGLISETFVLGGDAAAARLSAHHKKSSVHFEGKKDRKLIGKLAFCQDRR